MPFIALAVLGGSYYQAQQNRQAMSKARDEASRATAVAAEQKEAERIKKMQRSGSRSLLSQTRLAPELGLGNGDMTLGAGIAI